MFIRSKFKEGDVVSGLICKFCGEPFSLVEKPEDQPERMIVDCIHCLQTERYLREDVRLLHVHLKTKS